jgi:FimV-like protein
MKTSKASVRTIALLFLSPLACPFVLAQEFGAPIPSFESSNQTNATAAEADSATSFRLSGVIVSQSRRSALVNSTVFREGDRVGGAEILAIVEGGVRILVGSREFTVRVGSTFVAAQFNSAARHLVQQGETLSQIAQRHLADGVTMNQMMIAMFRANPQAFGGNINVMRAGAHLRIPDPEELYEQSPALARAAVMRHMDAWQTGSQQQIQLADEKDPGIYGPVARGETLSGIAVRLARNGASMNQTMIALAEANPQAFGGNINILLAGAVLKIPDAGDFHRHAPEAATAEVGRHMEAYWSSGVSAAVNPLERLSSPGYLDDLLTPGVGDIDRAIRIESETMGSGIDGNGVDQLPIADDIDYACIHIADVDRVIGCHHDSAA